MASSEKIVLKKLNIKKDITRKYQKWINDYEVMRYTEQKFQKHTLLDIKNFVKKQNKSKISFLYGIFLKNKNSNLHIGNIKLGPIFVHHKTAEISYFIGEKKIWGKGYATYAIKKIIKIAKKKGIKKLRAGFYKMNVASKKALIKNNFKIEGEFKSEIIYEGKRTSRCWFGKVLR